MKKMSDYNTNEYDPLRTLNIASFPDTVYWAYLDCDHDIRDLVLAHFSYNLYHSLKSWEDYNRRKYSFISNSNIYTEKISNYQTKGS